MKNYIVKNGLNQQMFADLVGCCNQSVSRWLRGENEPSGPLRRKVDAILDSELKVGEKEVSLTKNGSGYYDPTAHKAFTNIIIESKPACLRGDIYTFEMKNNLGERKILVVGSDDRKTDRWISVLFLNDEEKGKNVVPIIAGPMMYVDCDRVTFVDRNSVLNFVRTATDEEMAMINKAICESLAISTSDAELYNKYVEVGCHLEKTKEENEILRKDCEVFAAKNYELKEELRRIINDQDKKTINSDEVLKLQAMVDVYKEQNEMLLEKLIG
jgi:hypothetical protein